MQFLYDLYLLGITGVIVWLIVRLNHLYNLHNLLSISFYKLHHRFQKWCEEQWD